MYGILQGRQFYNPFTLCFICNKSTVVSWDSKRPLHIIKNNLVYLWILMYEYFVNNLIHDS